MAEVALWKVSKVFADGTRAVESFDLEVAEGELVVLVGPSGCGKSTILRMLAGLEEVSSGEIRIDGRVVNHLPPQRRDVAMVFQNYALYPHMTVRQNMAFPLRMTKQPRGKIEEHVRKTASMLGLESLLNRRPGQLSGGQRQRVAMGRALVREPSVFLMDEPLSNLDAKLRVQMRAEITALQKRLGTTTLYVTHDQAEAMTMGNRLAVLRAGQLQQVGPPQELYDHPANVFVAGFLGSPAMNLFLARIDKRGSTFGFPVGDQWLPLLSIPRSLSAHDELIVGIRPESIVPADMVPENQRIALEAASVELLGHEQLVSFKAELRPVPPKLLSEHGPAKPVVSDESAAEESQSSQLLVARFAPRHRIHPRERVRVGVDVTHLHFFDLEGRGIADTAQE